MTDTEKAREKIRKFPGNVCVRLNIVAPVFRSEMELLVAKANLDNKTFIL